MALVCSLVVVCACSGPSAQAIPTPAGGVLLSALPHLPGAPTAAATAKAEATGRVRLRPNPTPADHTTTPTKPPVATGPKTILGGCQVFPANNPWNENVSNLPVTRLSIR